MLFIFFFVFETTTTKKKHFKMPQNNWKNVSLDQVVCKRKKNERMRAGAYLHHSLPRLSNELQRDIKSNLHGFDVFL